MLLKWTSKLFLKNLFKAISFSISLIIVFTLFSSPSIAAKTSMTGDYTKDTISVVKTLQTAVDTPKDSPIKDQVKFKDAELIGIPFQIIIGRDSVNKEVEVINRLNNAKFKITVDKLLETFISESEIMYNKKS